MNSDAAATLTAAVLVVEALDRHKEAINRMGGSLFNVLS
jgi:hypothetical protein